MINRPNPNHILYTHALAPESTPGVYGLLVRSVARLAILARAAGYNMTDKGILCPRVTAQLEEKSTAHREAGVWLHSRGYACNGYHKGGKWPSIMWPEFNLGELYDTSVTGPTTITDLHVRIKSAPDGQLYLDARLRAQADASLSDGLASETIKLERDTFCEINTLPHLRGILSTWEQLTAARISPGQAYERMLVPPEATPHRLALTDINNVT